MSSGDWHRFNGHLKSLIIEEMDAPLKIDIGDFHVVCFNVSLQCRGNTAYFKQLGKVLDHPDAPEVVMRYLLSLDLSDFESQEIPITKMKSDIIVDELSKKALYQKYLEWCGENDKKPFSNNIAGKKFSNIDIESKQVRIGGGKREWHYILDRSKIISKLRKSGLDDIEEFSDIPQLDLPKNETTDIPIFNVPETISKKIIPPQPEKNMPLPNTSKDKKADKQGGGIQDLFDYVVKDTCAPVASTSGIFETIKLSESIDIGKFFKMQNCGDL
ncbi:hypothetical protein RhiirA5_431014 [Rhizophagus irregularis]|uniref:DNA primase/nucleoside triphosphatase C-terminal domain-containing protein n=1 Tax=Rhizophagus irregularis TaxID=588596 RepID=A0A2N0NVS5_9GLOM|nr:hypothetical protein RhiirA5_431014 [Rhizophagus irregularis]